MFLFGLFSVLSWNSLILKGEIFLTGNDFFVAFIYSNISSTTSSMKAMKFSQILRKEKNDALSYFYIDSSTNYVLSQTTQHTMELNHLNTQTQALRLHQWQWMLTVLTMLTNTKVFHQFWNIERSYFAKLIIWNANVINFVVEK